MKELKEEKVNVWRNRRGSWQTKPFWQSLKKEKKQHISSANMLPPSAPIITQLPVLKNPPTPENLLPAYTEDSGWVWSTWTIYFDQRN